MSRIAYSSLAAQPGSLMPRLSLDVFSENHAVQLSGIVDSGSATNLVPYTVGRSLGFDWNRQRSLGRLSGGLSNISRVPYRYWQVFRRLLEPTKFNFCLPGQTAMKSQFCWDKPTSSRNSTSASTVRRITLKSGAVTKRDASPMPIFATTI